MALLLLMLLAGPVQFRARFITYHRPQNLVILQDSAFVQSGKTQLWADSILYWTQDKKLRAYKGFVLVLGQKDTLRGDSLFYNIETEHGISFDSRTHIEKGYLLGRRFYRTGPHEVIIEEGTFTTCDETPPHYVFYSPKMRVFEDDMAIASPVIFKIMGIPILELPFWYFPVANQRKSGFLTPRYGRQSQDGFYIRNLAYYWAINNYMDLTVALDLIEKRGPRLSFTLPYKVYGLLEGRWTASWAEELSPRKRRWSIFGNHSQDLGPQGRLVAKVSYVSDKNYIYDYSEEKQEWLQTELVSYVSYTRRWRNLTMSLVAEDRRDLVRNTLSRTLPRWSLSLPSLSIGPVQISTQNLFERGITQDLPAYRWVAEHTGNLQMPWRLFRYFQLNPSLSWVVTLYDHDTLGTSYRLRMVPTFQTSVTTVLYGLSKFGIGPVQRILQVLRPTLTYRFRPDIDQGWIDPFRGHTPLNGFHQGSFSLSNEYQAKIKWGDQERRVTFLTSSLQFSYNLKSEGQKITPITVTAQLFPGSKITIRGNTQYDPETRRWSSIEVITSARWSAMLQPSEEISTDTLSQRPLRWSVTVNHTYRKEPARNYLTLSLSGNLTKYWRVSYQTGYNFVTHEMIDQSLSLERDLHCFRASFRWSTFGGIWIYDFKIWITALPEIKLQRSTLEAILP